MKKGIQFLSAFMSVMLMAGLAAGCSKQSTSSGTSGASGTSSTSSTSSKPTKLVFIVPQNSFPSDWQLVMDQFKKETKDSLNVDIDLQVTGFDNVGQKVSLKLTSGQQVDSVFAAQWTNPTINSMAIKGQLLDLDSYFNNDAYAGLKKEFTSEYLQNNMFQGKDGKYGVYGIPFSNAYATPGYLYYRLDLAKKYGLGELKNYSDVFKFFQAVKQNGQGVVPYTFLGTQDTILSIAGAGAFAPQALSKHNYDLGYANGVQATGVVIKPDGTAYVSRSVDPLLDPTYVSYMPAGAYDTSDPMYDYKAARDWYSNGYISKDCLNVKDFQAQFCSGKAAAMTRGADVYSSIANQLSAGVPNSELGIVNLDALANVSGQHGITFQAWNFACVPSTSKNADKVMQFYNWIFSSQANHDLFELGIEGKHWTAKGSDAFTTTKNPDTGKNWDFGAYVMTWNPLMSRVDGSLPQNALSDIKRYRDTSYYYKLCDAGFTFDDTNVKAISTQVSDIKSNLLAVQDGTVADYAGAIKKIDSRLKAANYEAYCQEYEKQLNVYLKDHPYKGQ